MTDPWLVDVEAYVLGSLGEPERTAFEEHLRGCATCRAAVDEAGALPALLDMIPPDVVAQLAAQDPVAATVPRPPDEQVPDSVLAGLLWSLRRRTARRRRRITIAALAAAAALVLALVLPASPIALVGREGPATQQIALRPVTASPVTATLTLEDVAWGTRIELRCSYTSTGSSGVYSPGTTLALVLLDDDGVSEQVATWAAVPGRTITVPAATDRRRDQIASIELQTSDGQALLTADVS